MFRITIDLINIILREAQEFGILKKHNSPTYNEITEACGLENSII